MNAELRGMTTKKIIVSPCIVKIWLYRSAERTSPSGPASCARISSASLPPTTKKVSDATAYMMPMRLWSTVVSQDFQPVVWVGRGKIPRRRALVAPCGFSAMAVMLTPASLGRR